MSDYYILDGKTPVKCDVSTWGRWRRDHDADRRVAFTKIGNVEISTVFLGSDHSFGLGPPLLFETLVLGGVYSDEMDRYSTWDEAETGHARMVERVELALASAFAFVGAGYEQSARSG